MMEYIFFKDNYNDNKLNTMYSPIALPQSTLECV